MDPRGLDPVDIGNTWMLGELKEADWSMFVLGKLFSSLFLKAVSCYCRFYIYREILCVCIYIYIDIDICVICLLDFSFKNGGFRAQKK